MSTQPTELHPQTNQMNASSGQDKTYIGEKLRGAAVMYGPAVVLDLFEGTSVFVMASGKLSHRQGSRSARILRPIMVAGTLLPWVYLLLVRPWHMNWGATGEEVRKRLPGDELVPHPTLESTRAITIRAPAKEVWRWLVQLGQDRGGFYSYDCLENLAGADIHNVERIVPEMQRLNVGDFVPMAPVEWGVPMGGFTVVMMEPERAILWRQGWPEDVDNMSFSEAQERGTWAFVLEEVDEDHAPALAGAKRPQAAYAGCDLQLPVHGEAALHHGAEDAQRDQGTGRTSAGHADGRAILEEVVLGFLFSGIALEIYFRSWVDLIVPTVTRGE